MVGKYSLICSMEIHMVVHIFSGFALFTELLWVYRGVESLCKLLTVNKVLFDLATNDSIANTSVKTPLNSVDFTIHFGRARPRV